MTPARAGASAVAGVLGAAVLLVLLVTWAASIGPDQVLSGGRVDRGTPTPTAAASSTAGIDRDLKDELVKKADSDPPGWVRTVALVLEVATLCVVLFLLYRLGRGLKERWQARTRRARRATEDVEFEVLDTAGEVAAAIEQDAAEQRTLLEQGEARNAIVDCWRRFEVQAGRAGVVRRPWQTPSEFVLWVLDVAGADTQAVTRLSELYREARFSDHPIGETHRSEALAALEAIHRTLLPGASPTLESR